MLRGYSRGTENRLQAWDIEPDDSDSKRENDCREEVQILRLFLERRWVLED